LARPDQNSIDHTTPSISSRQQAALSSTHVTTTPEIDSGTDFVIGLASVSEEDWFAGQVGVLVHTSTS
jgi:hypothetical protein